MKTGVFNLNGKRNLKKLLDQLATRDIQSTQLKISEVINKQKCNLKLARSLNPSHTQNVKQSLFIEYNGDLPIRRGTTEIHNQKQNLRQKQKYGRQSATKTDRNYPISTAQRKSTRNRTICFQVGRYEFQKADKKKNGSIGFPLIYSKITKTNSLQNIAIQEFDQNKKTVKDVLQLEIIEEQLNSPNKHSAFGANSSNFHNGKL